MLSPILQIKNLQVTFHHGSEKTVAVKEISFSMEKGKTLGIVGESGSGKSVTALSILQLLPHGSCNISAGGMFFHDRESRVDLLSLEEKEMRDIRGNRISMIFQEPMTSLNPVIRCGHQVTEAIRAHQDLSSGQSRKKALRLFSEVQLPRPESIFHSYPFELSGGQKHRVMIAMAIASRPDILIADEPTTALDVTVQKAILELIRALQKKYGMAVLFITHDLGLVSSIADDVLVMKAGEIVESGPATGIFNKPAHPYTRGLLACRPQITARLNKLPTIEDFADGDAESNFLEKYLEDPGEIARSRQKIYSRRPVINVSDIRTWFPVKRGLIPRKTSYIKAVDGISIDMYRGETLGLVGESGCGKTTLGRSVLRLIEPTGGEILYLGKNLVKMSRKELRKSRKNLQIIFQDPYSSLNPRITAGRAIMEPMIAHRLHGNNASRKNKAMELMEKVGLEKHHYDRYPHEFSGGQRQRICIARALAVEPEVIICDESVSALDVSVQAQVLNLLNELKKEFGLTYLFISHDLSVVKFMSDRIIVMKDGKIEEEGDPDNIYKSPKSTYTRKLIESIPM